MWVEYVQGTKSVKVFLLNFNSDTGGCKIARVRVLYRDTFHGLTEKDGPKEAQIFSADVGAYQKEPFEFFIEILETKPNFSLKWVDNQMNDMWTAAENQQLTDVQFVVRERTFHAHKAIVAARSPVFLAMFTSDMLEAKTERVVIEDIEADTFEAFLKFLYLGQLDDPEGFPQLLMAADKYQVDTLKTLCSEQRGPFSEDEVETMLFHSMKFGAKC